MEDLRVRFDAGLRDLLHGINVQRLSRVPASRLVASALPNIGLVELGSAAAFETCYRPLYTSMFHGGERERPELISDRLQRQFGGKRAGVPPYRFIGIRNPDGIAIAGVHFAILPLRSPPNPQQPHWTVPFVHYIYVGASNRRQDLSEVLHTLALAVAVADGSPMDGGASDGDMVPFTIFETEPPGYGTEQSSRTNATERTTIHARSGARAMMLRSRADGRLRSAHVQPGLEPNDPPMTLTWVLRPSPVEVPYDKETLGRAVIEAYYQSLQDEGFPELNVALAQRMAMRRCEGADFCELSLAEVTTEMYHCLEENGTES